MFLTTLNHLVHSAARHRCVAAIACGILALQIGSAQGQDEGYWNVNNNGNWSAATNWLNGIVPGLSTNSTGGIDDIANLTFQITTTRTITIDAGVPGTNVTLGTLNIGDVSGNHVFNISGGRITFDVSSGNAQLNQVNDGGNVTISSALTINDTLDITTNDPTNNSGILLSGVISGGTPGTVTMTFNDLSTTGNVKWLILNASAGNDFQGQLVIESGLLRLEGHASRAAGAAGVGNETIARTGGAIDLRDRDTNVAGDATEIYRVSGVGTHGLGAFRNTSGTATFSHVILDDDATFTAQGVLALERRMNTANNAAIAPILDFDGHTLTKIGIGDFYIRSGDIRNAAGAVLDIREGEVRFENRGAMTGGGGGSINDIDGLTVNLIYNRNPYDNADLSNGSRTTNDLFNIHTGQTAVQGNAVVQPRLSFGTYWGETVAGAGGNAEQIHVVDNFGDLTINFNNGVIQREGNSEAGRTFDQILGPGSVINLVGGGIGRDSRGSGNLFDINGGSGVFNANFGVYDHPGVFEIQGQFDNTTNGNAGTGFTVRGSREMRLTHANPNFNGDVLVKLPTNRWIGPNFTSGLAESTYTNLSLAGPNGTLNNANSITLTRMGSLALLNNTNGVYGSANNNDRLNDDGFLNLRNGVLKIETDVVTTNTENVGKVVADMGTNFIYLETRAGGNFDGAFQSFTRNNGSILKIIDTNTSHTWGSAPGGDRIQIVDTTGILTIGANAPGTAQQNVVPGIFGGILPSFSPGTGSGSIQTPETLGNAAAFYGVGIGLMTLDNGYLRPLAPSEFHASGTPAADSNWLVNAYIGTATEYVGNRDLYASRNVPSDMTINSLTIAHDTVASGQAVVIPVSNVDTSKDYVIIDTGATLTIKSGVINFATVSELVNANTTPIIRGGFLDMNGQQAIINSASTWHDLDTSSGTGTSIMVGNNAFIRSHIINANGLVKTGRNNLYLETWNDFSGNIYVSDVNSLVVRHHGALGQPAPDDQPRREVIVAGTGNFLLEYGVNIKGFDVRATNTMDTTHAILRNEGTTHSTWGGNVIIDGADGFGSANEASYTVTARNNGTLTLHGNIYTDNNQNFTDDDAFADPPLVTTSIGETYTLNLRGQFRDVATGNLGTLYPDITSIFRTGDSATRMDANHSLRFQMTGHDEGNVNAFQQWDATGRIEFRQGYFRIAYDPTLPGANGFYTDSARALLAAANDYHGRVALGADGTSTTNAYHSHLMLTRDGQVFNAPYIYAYNDNRQGTQTIGGESESGTVYYGSIDNTVNFSLQYANQNTERDIRFLQVRGGNLVFNGRLDDEAHTTTASTADGFRSVATIIGPGTVTFNRNAIGASDIDRWNFLGGVTHWGTMLGNNEFARVGSTATGTLFGSRLGLGGGHLVLDAQPTARIQTLDGDIFLLGGSGSVTANDNTTLVIGNATRVITRNHSGTITFLENDNGAIDFSAASLSTTDGAFLGAWGLYGTTDGGVTDWAARQGTTGVQAFANYDNDAFGAGNHTNLTTDAVVPSNEAVETLRFGSAADLDIAPGARLSLNQGSVLIPSTVTGDVNISGGSLTSAWTAGGNDLMIHNFGEGRTSVLSVITDNGSSRVNFVHDGDGTTVLGADNTFTGDHYFNGGVVEISSEAQLGDVNGRVIRLARVNSGSNGGVSTPAGTAFTVTGGGGGSGFAASYRTNSSQAIDAVTVMTNGGSGYTSGLYLNTKADLTGNAAVWAILDSGNLHFDGGALRVTDDINLNSGRTVYIGANGATLDVVEGKTLTINGYITSEYSHATPANGYAAIDHTGAADDPASNRNPDIGDLIIQGGGTVNITGAPDGTVRANMFQSYGGITWVNEGVLRLSAHGGSGGGILGTNRSFVDGTIIGDEGTLFLSMITSDPVITEWITFRGQGYRDQGTIKTAGVARSYRLAGQNFIEEDILINNRNGSNIRFNEGGGATYGSGDIYRTGNGALQFYGNSPDWTGSLYNGSGDLYVTSAGNLQGMKNMLLERNTIIYVESNSASIDEFRDRLADDLTITTNGYIRTRLRSLAGVHSGEEDVGAVNVAAGQLGIEFDIGADLLGGQPRLQGDYSFWHFDSINRGTGTSVHFRVVDAGVQFANSNFGAGQLSNVVGIKVDTMPTMTGSGNGLAGNAPVAVGMFGGERPLWANLAGTGNVFPESYMSSRLMTSDVLSSGQTILRPLFDSEYVVVESPNTALTSSSDLLDAGLSGDQNLRLVGTTTDTGIGVGEFTDRRNSILRLNSSQTVNSLTMASESYIDGAASGRGNWTALTMGPGGELVINSGMIVSSSRGIQNRAGAAHNTGINADIRNSINGGSLNFVGGDAHFNINDIWVHYNPSESPNAYHATDGDTAYLMLNSPIRNAANLIKTGPVSMFVQSANYYTGDTYINEGTLYARNDYALGNGSTVYLQGNGSLVAGHGSNITGKTIIVGAISGNNLAMNMQEGASWRGDIIIDNLNSSNAASYNRAYTPRIYSDSSYRAAVFGDIYGSSNTVGALGLTDARMFSALDTGTDGITEFRGRIRDNVNGAITGVIDDHTATQVLRMEIATDNTGYNVALYQPHDAAGRIRLLQGHLLYQGTGNFYSDAAAATVNANLLHPMLGFQMGGRSIMSSDGATDGDNISFFLANAGSVFNLSSWEVGVETYDPENLTGNGNYGLGNTTGNTLLGGLNMDGETTFGTGLGSIFFTQTTASYTRDLRLLAMPGGEVNIDANFVDGGALVSTSITKIGRGQVNLRGSAAGASSVEGVNVLGGMLLLENYGANASRRVGNGASLLMGGGILAVDGLAASGAFSEDFGSLTIRAGGSGIAAVGPQSLITIAGTPQRTVGGQLHFQTIAGGTIRLSGVAPNSILGGYATFGSSLSDDLTATDWAATDALGNIVAFTGYTVDAFGAGLHTDVVAGAVLGEATESLRFNDSSSAITAGSVILGNGGVLFTSNYGGGTPIAPGVTLTTAATATDLILHNFGTGVVDLAADIQGGQNVVFNGTGQFVLTGTNTYTGITFVTGAATVAFDDLTRFGSTSSFRLNGGGLNFAPAASTDIVFTKNVVLGSNDGVIQVSDPDSRLIFRSAAANQISSEANVVSYNSNPFSGGLTFLGPGTIQFGDRSAAATNVQDLLGVINDYTGLTIIGDGVTPVRVDIQGQGNDSAQYTPFGTTDSWADGTILRHNAILELSPKRGDASRDSQIQFREWFQIGEKAGDQILFDGTTQRQATFDGQLMIIGDLTFNARAGGYADAGSTGNSEFFINPNGGGLQGTGDIIKLGPGNLRLYQPMREWYGDLHIREGLVGIQSYQTSMFSEIGTIFFGDPNGVSTAAVQMRVEPRFGTGSTQLDSGVQNMEISRDIFVHDNIRQAVRIAVGYGPDATHTFTGDIYVGSDSLYTESSSTLMQVRFYIEDTTGLDGYLVGHSEHTIMILNGNLSGSNNVMFEFNEGGSANDDPNDQLGTFVLGGNNFAFTGRVTVGSEQGTGTGNFDRDDVDILRFGSNTGLSSANSVEMRNLSTLQVGGYQAEIGNLTANDGVSTTGLYSFSGPTWDPFRSTTADLTPTNADYDPLTGTYHGVLAGTVNYTPLGNSSAIVENASSTPGTLKVFQDGDTMWDVLFRDGVPDQRLEPGATTPGSLSLEKHGAGSAILTIFNTYTGTTTVRDGNLQVGLGGDGGWKTLNQGGTMAAQTASGNSGLKAAGSTGSGTTTVMAGASLSGSGHVRGRLVVHGVLAPGDTHLTYGIGAETGTLFIGSSSSGNLTIEAGALVKMQVASTPFSDGELNLGNYTIDMGMDYENYISSLPGLYSEINPSSFGQSPIVAKTQHDHLEIRGSLIWNGGALDLSATDSFIPTAGDVYNLIDWFGVATNWGSFNPGSSRYLIGNGDDDGDFNLPDLSGFDSNLRWDTGLFQSHGIVVISIVPEPGRALLLFAGLMALGIRRRRPGARKLG